MARLSNGKHLVIEVKGQDTQENRSKREFLKEWIAAVNEHSGFGTWASDVVLSPKEIVGVMQKHAGVPEMVSLAAKRAKP